MRHQGRLAVDNFVGDEEEEDDDGYMAMVTKRASDQVSSTATASSKQELLASLGIENGEKDERVESPVKSPGHQTAGLNGEHEGASTQLLGGAASPLVPGTYISPPISAQKGTCTRTPQLRSQRVHWHHTAAGCPRTGTGDRVRASWAAADSLPGGCSERLAGSSSQGDGAGEEPGSSITWTRVHLGEEEEDEEDEGGSGGGMEISISSVVTSEDPQVADDAESVDAVVPEVSAELSAEQERVARLESLLFEQEGGGGGSRAATEASAPPAAPSPSPAAATYRRYVHLPPGSSSGGEGSATRWSEPVEAFVMDEEFDYDGVRAL